MFGLLWPVQKDKAHRVAEMGAAIKQVFVRGGFPFKAAAFEMRMPAPNLSRALNEYGLSVTRLDMLPDAVKRDVWVALAPFFGVLNIDKASEDDLQKRLQEQADQIAELQKRDSQRQEQIDSLTRLVRESFGRPTEAPAEERERSCA